MADISVSPAALPSAGDGEPRPRPRDVLRIREYRGLFLAQVASLLGDQLAKIALAILVFRHTHSALLASLAFAVTYLPALIAGPLLGVFADTLPRRDVLIFCDVARSLIVGLMLVSGLPVGVLIALLFAVSLFESPFNAARSALLPDILAGDSYPVGQAIGSVTRQVTQILGFGVGGAVVALLSAHGALAIDAGTFLVSAALLRLYVVRRAAPARGRPQSRWDTSVAGAREVLGQPLLRKLIAITAVSFGLSIATEGLAVSYAHQLGRGDVATGVLTAALPLGSVVGMALITRVGAANRLRVIRLLGLLWPLPLIATITRPDVGVAACLWALTGAFGSFHLLGNVLFAQALPTAVRGRAFAFAQTLLTAVQGFGLVVLGLLAQLSAPSTAVAIAGLAGLVFCTPIVVRLGGRSGAHCARALSVTATPADDGRVPTVPREEVSPTRGVGRRRAKHPTASPVAGLEPRLRAGCVFVVALAVGGGSVAFVLAGFAHGRPSGTFQLAWWVLAAIFAAAAYFKIPFQRGAESHSVMGSQLPMLLGLYFTGPTGVLAASLVGNAAVSLLRHPAALKYVVNRSINAVEVLAAVLVFGALRGHAAPTLARGWAAGAAAIACSEVASFALIFLVRRVFEPQLRLSSMRRPLAFTMLVTLITVGLGLLAVTAMYENPSSGLLLLCVGGLVAVGLRAYANLQERHLGLGRLYAFQEQLGTLVPKGESLFPVLEHARDLLVAEEVSLELPDDGFGPVGHRQRLRVRADEPPMEEWAPVSEQTDAAVTPPHGLAVVLKVGERVVGSLRARTRLGSIRGFNRNDLRLLETLGAQVSDALERGTLLERLQEAATHDRLTGLLTLNELMRQLDLGLLVGTSYLVALLDVARLQDVNDSLGHEAGDALLRTVGTRLTEVMPKHALLARSGGGEFAVAVAEVEGYQAFALAERIAETVTGLVQVLGVTVDLRSRTGWLTAPGGGNDAATLVRRADLALAAAKRGLRPVARYTPALEVDGRRRLQLVNDLREAITDRALDVVYQPLVTPGDGRVVGAEALVRWTHSVLGPLQPDEFVVIAEQSGLIGDLTAFVLDEALAQTRRWQQEGREIRIAVNLSARCLTDMSLPGTVLDLLARHRLDPSRLTLEVTETSVAEDPARALAVLDRLRSVGVRLSIDDFGTGYSSLASLKRFPVQEVKIDRQFLTDLDVECEDDASSDLALLSAVVALGHSLHLEIVAEGVETELAYRRLRDLGVDVLQGYYVGRPGPGCELPKWADSGHAKIPTGSNPIRANG